MSVPFSRPLFVTLFETPLERSAKQLGFTKAKYNVADKTATFGR